MVEVAEDRWPRRAAEQAGTARGPSVGRLLVGLAIVAALLVALAGCRDTPGLASEQLALALVAPLTQGRPSGQPGGRSARRAANKPSAATAVRALEAVYERARSCWGGSAW